jgi:hypothetical protein
MPRVFIKDTNNPMIFKDGEFWYQWCCNCYLRHIYLFKIIRGKKPKNDRVVVYLARDDWATNARRREKRHKKQIKRKSKRRAN